MTIAYYVKDGLYLNITNRCSANCDFCLRRKMDSYGTGGNLWLRREPEVSEILDAVFTNDWKSAPEIVFCGFGEPTMRFEDMLEVSRALKNEHAGVNLRLNTNGLGSLTAGRDIAPELKNLFRTVSVSLNYPDEQAYIQHCRPIHPTKAYGAVLDFVQSAALYVPNVVITVTSLLSQSDIDMSRKIAKNLGVGFRVRESE